MKTLLEIVALWLALSVPVGLLAAQIIKRRPNPENGLVRGEG